MAKRIRITEVRKPASFGERLEDRTREAIRDRPGRESSAVTEGTRRELALTLDHIERIHALHENLRRNLKQHELYLSTEILQREPRGSQVYRDYRLPERDRLRDRLREIDAERRRLAMWREEHVARLHDRLLALYNRLTQLQF